MHNARRLPGRRSCKSEHYTARLTRIRERRNGRRHKVVCLVEAHHIGEGLGMTKATWAVILILACSVSLAACSPTTTAVSSKTASKTWLNQGTNASGGGGGGGGGGGY